MTQKKKLFFILVIGWICFIFGQSLMDHSVSYSESAAIWEPMQEITPEVTHKSIRKLAHFALFGIWGVFLYGLFRQYEHFHLLKPIGIALCGGFADETIQLFVPGRYGSVIDIWIDLAGAVCFILLTHLIMKLYARRLRKKPHTEKTR